MIESAISYSRMISHFFPIEVQLYELLFEFMGISTALYFCNHNKLLLFILPFHIILKDCLVYCNHSKKLAYPKISIAFVIRANSTLKNPIDNVEYEFSDTELDRTY